MSARARPLVTVILPVRNEIGFIERSVGSVLGQTWGMEHLQVLVVDGLSDDGTRELVERLRTEHPAADLELLDNPGRTAPCALNVGLRRARGEVIVRVDGHCEIESEYVERAMEILRRHPEVDGVGGVLRTFGEETRLVADAVAAAMSSRFGVGGSAFRVLEPGAELRPTDTVVFAAYRREAVAANGGFDEELVRNQDEEWNYRLRKRGGRLVTSGDLVARYASRSSLRKMARQYFQYGFYKVRVLQLHPRQMHPRQFVPPLFVLALLLGIVLALLRPPLGVPFPGFVFLALVAGSYAAANLLASAWTAWRKGWRLLPLLPLTFGLLHVSYGSGFLAGFFRWAGRWGDADGRVPDLGWGDES